MFRTSRKEVRRPRGAFELLGLNEPSNARTTLILLLEKLRELPIVPEPPESLLEEWIAHLGGKSKAPAGRNNAGTPWPELRNFVSKTRRIEHDYVADGFSDLRKVIWSFVEQLGETFNDDEASEKGVSQQLERLREAMESDSLEELKREAQAAIGFINNAVQERRRNLRSTLKELGSQLQKVQGELERAKEDLAVDPMTKVFNRASFDKQVERMAYFAIFSREAPSLIMLDLDHFKKINDSYGHPAGDAVLKRVADLVVSSFPRKGDFVARYGGEEFAILLHGEKEAATRRMGQRLVETIRTGRFQFEDSDIEVTASLGMAILEPGEDAQSWIKRADRALYEAKKAGRDQMVVADWLSDEGEVQSG